MEIPDGFLTSEKARKHLGVTDTTLRNWADKGLIEYVRGTEKGSHRYYNIKQFLRKNGTSQIKEKILSQTRRKICYCRVSTRNQKDDLQRQVDFLQRKYPNHEIIKDIGSGINFKRKGLKTILDYAIKGDLEELVVAYKDRLCRFGFDLIKWIIEEYSSGKIVVLNEIKCSAEQEVVTDVLTILNVFSARINGLRKYRTQVKEEFEQESEGNPEIVFED
jgi:putative resolvase